MKKLSLSLHLLSFFFFLFACTTTRVQRNDRPLNLEKWLVMNAPPQICLAGEGKGRAVSHQGEKMKKLSFDYSSLWKTSDIWLLAIDISLHGEETLFISRKEKQIKMSGTLEKYFASHLSMRDEWGKFLFAVKSWSEISANEKQKNYPHDCEGSLECKWKWRSLDFRYSENSLSITSNGMKLLLKNWTDEWKKFDSLLWASKDQSVTDFASLELELHPSDCTEK